MGKLYDQIRSAIEDGRYLTSLHPAGRPNPSVVAGRILVDGKESDGP